MSKVVEEAVKVLAGGPESAEGNAMHFAFLPITAEAIATSQSTDISLEMQLLLY